MLKKYTYSNTFLVERHSFIQHHSFSIKEFFGTKTSRDHQFKGQLIGSLPELVRRWAGIYSKCLKQINEINKFKTNFKGANLGLFFYNAEFIRNSTRKECVN